MTVATTLGYPGTRVPCSALTCDGTMQLHTEQERALTQTSLPCLMYLCTSTFKGTQS